MRAWLDDVVRRLRGVGARLGQWRRSWEREVDDEVRFHLQMETQKLVASGVPADRARRQARLNFGGEEWVRERRRSGRGGNWIAEALRDARAEVRRSIRRPVFAAAVIGTFAAGVGATVATWSVLRAVALRPLPFAEPSRLVVVDHLRPEDGAPARVSALDLADLRDRSSTFDGLAGWVPQLYSLTGEGEPEKVSAIRASAELFLVLGRTAAIGRTFGPDDQEPRTVVLAHGFWQRRYGGDVGVVGRTLTLDDASYEIVGVMARDFRFPDDPGVQLWLPMELQPWEARFRTLRNLAVIGRLAPGAGVERAEEDLARITEALGQEYPASNADYRTRVRPAGDALMADAAVLWLLLGAVSLVLAIACANAGGLLLARQSDRGPELAIRQALGAGRARLVRQLVVEALVLGGLGGAAGIALAALAVRGLDLTTADLATWHPIRVDGPIVLQALALTLVSALIASLGPSLLGAARAPGSYLRTRDGLGPARGRSATLGLEVAVTVVLLSGAGLLVNSLLRVQAVDPGFEPQGLITGWIELPDSRYPDDAGKLAAFDAMRSRVESVPAVASAAFVTTLPLSPVGTDYDVDIALPDQVAGTEPSAQADFRAASAGYFGTIGVPVVVGREFAAGDRPDGEPVVVVNRTFVERFFGGGDAVGREVLLFGEAPPRRIVGVVGDVRHRGLDGVPRPEVYAPLPQFVHDGVTLVARARGASAEAAPALRAAVRAVDPDLPVASVRTGSELLGDAAARWRFAATLLSAFAGIGLMLSMAGLYGLLTYQVVRRRREIGLRMALGAGRSGAVTLLARQLVPPLVLGTLAGLAGALLLGGTLRSLLFGVAPTDPVTLATALGALLSVVILTGTGPALRAARSDPAAALRDG